MRLFLAVFPPPATQAFAERAITALRSPGDGVSWVKRENLHYTLRFLGEQDEGGARRAEEAAREAAAGHARFDARLGMPGAFPFAKSARVLWLGLAEGGEALVDLARSLERALEARGFAREGREFAPHLTIGRVRDGGRDWSRALALFAPPADEPTARFEVRALELVESTLAPGGSRYRVRASAPLSGA